MSQHTPYVVDTIAPDCLEYECEHDDPDNCPLTPMVACEGCMAGEDETDWAPVTEWPCIHTTRRGTEDEVRARLLNEYTATQTTTPA